MSTKIETNGNLRTDADKAVTQLQKMLEECNALKRKLKCMQLLEESSEKTKNSGDLCGLDYKSNSDFFRFTENSAKGEPPREKEDEFIDRNCAEGESCEANHHPKIELQEKLQDFAKGFRKLQAQYKSTLKGLKTKDLIITELNEKILKSNDKNNALQNELSKLAKGEIEFASFQKNLEKQLEKKDWEISELQSKLLKDAQIKSNLLKDIEYYKNEAKNKGKADLPDPQRKYDAMRVENETLCVKLKEIIGVNGKTQQKLNEKITECNNFRDEVDVLKDDLAKAKIAGDILEAERNEIFSQHSKVLSNVNATDKYLLTRESVDIKLRRQNNKLVSENNVCKLENQRLKNLLALVEKTKKELKGQNEQLVEDNAKIASEKKTSAEFLEKANGTLTELQSQNESLNQDLFDSITRTEHLETELKTRKTQNRQLEKDMETSLARRDEIIDQMERVKFENNELRNNLDKLRSETGKPTEDKSVETKILIRDAACQNSEIHADKNLQTDDTSQVKICENCELIKRKLNTTDAIQHFEENFVRKVVFEKSCENCQNPHYESLLRKTSSLEEKFEYLEDQFLRFNSGKYSDDTFFSTRSVRSYGGKAPKFSKETMIRELAENLGGSSYNLQNIESDLNVEQEKLLTALHNLKMTKEKLCREKYHW